MVMGTMEEHNEVFCRNSLYLDQGHGYMNYTDVRIHWSVYLQFAHFILYVKTNKKVKQSEVYMSVFSLKGSNTEI